MNFLANYMSWFDALPWEYRVPLGLLKAFAILGFMFYLSDTAPRATSIGGKA